MYLLFRVLQICDCIGDKWMYCSGCSQTFCFECFVGDSFMACNVCCENRCGKCMFEIGFDYLTCSVCYLSCCDDKCTGKNDIWGGKPFVQCSYEGCNWTKCGRCSRECEECDVILCEGCSIESFCSTCSKHSDCTDEVYLRCHQCDKSVCMDCQRASGVFCSKCQEPLRHDLSFKFVRFLHNHSANMDAVDGNGCNVLHLAASRGQRESCLLLISLGLDPAKLDDSGTSALERYANALEEEDDVDVDIDEMVSSLTAAREQYLQNIRDSNWGKNKSFLAAIIGSGLRLTAAESANLASAQEISDKSVALPSEPRGTKAQNIAYLNRQVFGHDGIVRLIASFIIIDPAAPRIVPYVGIYDDDDDDDFN